MKHKRISRAGISLLLVLCMVLSICPLTAFAKEDDRPKLNYVSLGASNVNGYGLRGYLKATGYGDDNDVMEAAALNSELKKNANVLGYNQAPAGSYPALLQEALSKQQGNTVNLSQLAISSMRAEELRILLDNNYNGDAYSAWRFIGKGNWFDIADGKKDGKFEQLREEYQTAVKNADLITVDIGANNFGVYLSFMLTSNFSLDNNLELVDPQIGKLYNDAKAQVNALFAKYGISMTDYEKLADTLVYALVGFCYNFDKSMESIFELNPDATVVVVSIQNLMAGLGAKLGDVEVPLGDIIGALINTANTYIAIGSPYSSKYLCADVRQNGRVEFFIDKMAAYDGNPANLDENIIDCFDVWDGSPGASYDGGFHIKYQVAKLAIQKSKATQENVAAYLNDGEGKALLYKVYDAYAQIMSTAAKYDTLDLSALTVDSKSIEDALTTGIWNAVWSAVTTEGTYTLPDEFFSDIANNAGVSESVVKTIAAMAVRTDIGNSFFGHPTPKGHQKVADAILATLANKTTGEDIIKNEIEIAGEQLYRFAYDHGAESLVKVVDFVAGEGYITAKQAAMLKNQINLADPAIKSGDKQAILASCEKLADMLYTYACDNGYVPEEVQEAIAKAIELYEKYGEMTPEEIKALAVAELKKFVAEHKAEALIALDTYLVNEGWMSTTEMKELAEKIAAAIAAYEADPEGTADKMIEELVNYIYNKAVAEGYIDPTKVEELNKLVDLIKEACDYFANTSEEQIKADAIALLFDELDKLTDGKVNAEVYAQIKQDVAKLIAALEDVTPETIQAKVDAYIDSIKAEYLALIDNATHGKYVPNSESYYVALGGDTVYGTGIGRDNEGYFDLLLAKLGLDGKTQYKNLGEKNLDLTKLLAYIEKNADKIEKADLITYQADATAFILAALNEEEPDWSRYLTEEQIAFVEQALPVIQTILEDDWTKYADLDAEQIVNDIETEVLGAIDDAIMDAFNGQADKLDELLSICVAQVKSYVEYIQEQAFKLYFEAVIGETVLYYSLMKPVYEVLGEDWASYADLDVKQIVSEIKGEVLAKAGEAKNFSAEKINEVLAHCVEKALELHKYADAEIAKLPEYFSNEELAFAQAAFELVWEYAVKQWPELAELDVEELHEKAYTEIMKLLNKADNFNYEQYADLGAEKIEEILNCCVDKAMDAIEDIQSEAVEAVMVIDNAEAKFLEEAFKFAFDYLVEDWGTYVDKSAAWISNQIKDAVIAEMYKHSSFGKEYIDQYADDLAAILTACIEEVQNVLQTAQNQKDEVLNVLNTIEPFKPYIENLLFASVAYAVDTAKAVDAIQAINPDATLIVVGMYNPLDGLEIVMNGKTIDVGAYMDYLIDATNVYYTALAVADGEFTFVAVPDTEINGFENAINVDELNVAQHGPMLLKLNDSMYADAAGHKYIFEQIMGALDTTNDVVSISVTSAPTKTSYIAGQNFDSTGMAITATYYDGSTAIVEGWSVTDGNNLPAGKTSVTISYTEGGVTKTTSQAITVAAKTLSSISVKTAPTKTSYIAGQNFDYTGMVIEKKYNDNSTATAIGWTVTDGNNLPAGKISVTISYTEGGVTKTTSQAITVNSSNPGPGPGGGGGGAASYAVSAATATHGKVTVDKTSASAGDTVTITVVPEKGFTLETLTVKDAKGNEVALTAVKTGETYTFKMPAGKVTVSATFMEDNTMLNFFVDVPATEYYYDAVLWAAKNGITLGVDDTHFAPMAIATRGQMVTFLWRAAGCPEPTSTTCAFTDVKTSEYYYKAVLWAVETGITKGTSDTTFSPDENVSRSQTVTFLARMSGVKDDATGYSHNFADVKTTDYYNNAVAWAATNKITVGTSATTFSPNDDCLRGQIVTFLYRNFVK